MRLNGIRHQSRCLEWNFVDYNLLRHRCCQVIARRSSVNPNQETPGKENLFVLDLGNESEMNLALADVFRDGNVPAHGSFFGATRVAMLPERLPTVGWYDGGMWHIR